MFFWAKHRHLYTPISPSEHQTYLPQIEKSSVKRREEVTSNLGGDGERSGELRQRHQKEMILVKRREGGACGCLSVWLKMTRDLFGVDTVDTKSNGIINPTSVSLCRRMRGSGLFIFFI